MQQWSLNDPMGTSNTTGWSKLGLTDRDALGIAYLKSIRRTLIDEGFSFLCSVDGRHTSGKSVSTATICSIVDPTFQKNFYTRVIREHVEFADALENIYKNNIYGAGILVDEAGVSMSSSDWYEKWMKNLTKMTMMFGFLRPMVFFVAPQQDFVGSGLRKMFHAHYKLSRRGNTESFIKPYNCRYNSIFKKTMYVSPKLRIGSQTKILKKIILKRPPIEILEKYQQLETGVKGEMLQDFINEIRTSNKNKEVVEFDYEEATRKVISDYVNFESKRSKPDQIILDREKLKIKLRLKEKDAKYIKQEAEERLNEIQKKKRDINGF